MSRKPSRKLHTCLWETTALLLLFSFITGTVGKSQRYTTKPAPFSTHTNDEFSPVFYQGGIVFCSNQRDNSLIGYKDDQSRLFKLFYVSKNNTSGWKTPMILSKEISTNFHDGPVTFNAEGTILYYSRNNYIGKALRNISDTSNKLGIYSAELVNGIWTNIKSFAYNDSRYSFSTPALSPDGQRIYFSSDMPGGFGGTDLYYCNKSENDWCAPVNLGSFINTRGNESFPFADQYGRVYFASDGHPGFGAKDLFFTRENSHKWITPVHLDSAINSPADDFALVMDSTARNGFFSTNRMKSDDIFSFSTLPEVFSDCDTIQENNYCFTFYDEQHQFTDSLPVIYKWDFGNGILRTGTEVKNCFPGPGTYYVKLDITDELTGSPIASQVEYKVVLDAIEQPYINSIDVGIVDRPVVFDSEESNLKDFIPTDYLWDFGDGFEPGGPVMSHVFAKKGLYTVRLGMLARDIHSGGIQKTCVTKEVKIYNNFAELPLLKSEFDRKSGGDIQIQILIMDDLLKGQKAGIEKVFNDPAQSLRFDQYGIAAESYPFLDKAVAILKDNADIRLEMVIYMPEVDLPEVSIKMSEIRAQELAFYFKNKDIDTDRFHAKGLGLLHQLIQPDINESGSVTGTIEFIFTKR